MEKYSIESLKKTYKRMIEGNFENACGKLFAELAEVPAEYYNNIFFSGKAATTPVVVTDIGLKDGKMVYTIRNLNTNEKVKDIPYNKFPALTINVTYNIIGAIEVSRLLEDRKKQETKRKTEIIKQLKKAENRKRSQENEKDI